MSQGNLVEAIHNHKRNAKGIILKENGSDGIKFPVINFRRKNKVFPYSARGSQSETGPMLKFLQEKGGVSKLNKRYIDGVLKNCAMLSQKKKDKKLIKPINVDNLAPMVNPKLVGDILGNLTKRKLEEEITKYQHISIDEIANEIEKVVKEKEKEKKSAKKKGKITLLDSVEQDLKSTRVNPDDFTEILNRHPCLDNSPKSPNRLSDDQSPVVDPQILYKNFSSKVGNCLIEIDTIGTKVLSTC